MIAEMNVADEMRRLIKEGGMSEDALQSMTHLPPEKLQHFLESEMPGMTRAESQSLSNDESARLSILTTQLAEGVQIGDDERLKAIFESLTVECLLTIENIARLTGRDTGDLESALRDPRPVPIEKKYELAIKGSYLINAVNQARGR